MLAPIISDRWPMRLIYDLETTSSKRKIKKSGVARGAWPSAVYLLPSSSKNSPPKKEGGVCVWCGLGSLSLLSLAALRVRLPYPDVHVHMGDAYEEARPSSLEGLFRHCSLVSAISRSHTLLIIALSGRKKRGNVLPSFPVPGSDRRLPGFQPQGPAKHRSVKQKKAAEGSKAAPGPLP